jgi:hypothetical protein
MGYNITNDNGYEFTCTNWIWVTMLELAKENGWEPEGTELWEDDGEEIYFVKKLEWGDEGAYTDYDGQRMSHSDMEKMIAALKKADPDELADVLLDELIEFHESMEDSIYCIY